MNPFFLTYSPYVAPGPGGPGGAVGVPNPGLGAIPLAHAPYAGPASGTALPPGYTAPGTRPPLYPSSSDPYAAGGITGRL